MNDHSSASILSARDQMHEQSTLIPVFQTKPLALLCMAAELTRLPVSIAGVCTIPAGEVLLFKSCTFVNQAIHV
jgi:hypothetical protein